ncbi:MAG: phosphatase PAP2 family protein [Chromatiales bacterium]|nr:phosphatase PAP2 family protein [Chromatiales bacterium]
MSLVVFGWLIWRRKQVAAWHWLAALGFGMATNLLFRWLLPVSSPAEVSSRRAWAIRSRPATPPSVPWCSAFWRCSSPGEIPPARRWIAYLAAAFPIVPIAFARLYLGVHWLTDTLAGVCLGLIWVAVLGHGLQPPRCGGGGELAWVVGIQRDRPAGDRSGARQLRLSVRTCNVTSRRSVLRHPGAASSGWQGGWRAAAAATDGFPGQSPAGFRCCNGSEPASS